MKPKVGLSLNQTQKMAPKLQQAIRLLQLSTQELILEIQTALETNPLLELEDNEELKTLKPKADYAPQQSTEPTLYQHLMNQLALAPFEERDMMIASTLIESISEEGYLSSSLADIQESLASQNVLETKLIEIETMLHYIQQFDPLGVGARDLSECLTLQLNALPPQTVALKEAKILVQHHLEILAKHQYAKLRTCMQRIDDALLKKAINLVLKLNPRPAAHFSKPRKQDYIIPDLIVTQQNDGFKVSLNNNDIPKLRIRPLESHEDKVLNNYLQEAQWFLKSLLRRNATLLAVAKSILIKQHAFFTEQATILKPLQMQDIADMVGLHVSTISRITTQKYMFTPKGVFELKYFFSGNVNTERGKASTQEIHCLIKELIAGEQPLYPLSDEQIKDKLAIVGIHIARRTVTKYRESLRIPSASKRQCRIFTQQKE